MSYQAVNAITHHLERDSYTHDQRRAIAQQFGLSDLALRDCEGRARAALGMQRPKSPRELEEQFAQWLTELEAMRKEAMKERGPKDAAPNLTAAVRCHQLKGMALGYLGAERKGAQPPEQVDPDKLTLADKRRLHAEMKDYLVALEAEIRKESTNGAAH